MASFDALQDCKDTLEELKAVCAVSNEKHRDLFVKMADVFDQFIEKIEPNYWKASEENVVLLNKDLKALVEKVKYANKLMP